MNKQEKLLSAARLWALAQGMQEEASEMFSDGFVAKSGEDSIRFILKAEKTETELIKSIKKTNCDIVYIVIDDNKLRREIQKYLPKHCGILCYSNSFGLGFLYQELKKPIKKAG